MLKAGTIHPTLIAVVLLGLPTSVVAQRAPVPVTGTVVEVRLTDGQSVQGELIEVAEGNLLLSATSGLQEFTLDDLYRVRARRHDMTNGKVLMWIAIGALVTGGGLSAACSQVDGTSCGGVFPAVALSWVVVGGLAAAGIAGSRWRELPIQRDELSPYARFPQGAPAGFARQP